MYNYMDEKFLRSKNLSNFSLGSKNFNPFVRGRFDINNFSQLPAIKEEDGHISEEESEISSKTLTHLKSFTKLPPLNINCLMNIDVKQSQSVWNTNFGKRLLNETAFDDILNEVDTQELSFDNNSSNTSHASEHFSETKFVQKPISKNGKRDKTEFRSTKNCKKKFKKIRKDKNFMKKATIREKTPFKTTFKEKSLEKFPEISKKESLEESLTSSLDSKPQLFLTECVRSIFENYPNQGNCEHCNKSFSTLKELYNHQKQHEIEKETCLLCDKVFYNSNEFVKHLLTHEGVDRFSCKKCKKYFPNLKKLRQHHQDFHYKPPPTLSYIVPPKLEYIEKWLPKFECKRCKVEFDSVKMQEAHRRAHLKQDLASAYLLNLKKT